jgi:hypothetical protein
LKEPSIVKILVQFSNLTKALIDSSSIIYANKAGFLDKLGETIRLYAIPEILNETQHDYENIKIIKHNFNNVPTDKKLISVAFDQNLPVISEDKKILTALENRDIPYFNTLMMLNFLFYKNQISAADFCQYRRRLKDFAWYSQLVWEFGEKVFASIENLS